MTQEILRGNYIEVMNISCLQKNIKERHKMCKNRFKVIQFGCASSHMQTFCCKKLNMALVI